MVNDGINTKQLQSLKLSSRHSQHSTFISERAQNKFRFQQTLGIKIWVLLQMDSHCEAAPTAATGGTPALQGGVLADAVLQRVDHLPARDLEHHDLSVARRRGGAAGPGVGFPFSSGCLRVLGDSPAQSLGSAQLDTGAYAFAWFPVPASSSPDNLDLSDFPTPFSRRHFFQNTNKHTVLSEACHKSAGASPD